MKVTPTSCNAGRPALKVLFLSGYADDAVADQAGLVPGSAYLQKPIAVETLQDAIYPWRDGWLGALRDRRDTLQLKRWPLTTTPSLAGTAPPQAPVLSAVASAVDLHGVTTGSS